MFALAFLIVAVVAVGIDMPYKDLSSGEHWDCEKILSGKINANQYTDAQVLEIIDYCKNDRMTQNNSCGTGQRRDWKDGSCQSM
jgi:hypothetical protein